MPLTLRQRRSAIANSLNAIKARRGSSGRVIRIGTEAHETFVVVEVADSGTGIVNLSSDDIWLPGQTTTPHGTGLGLTIVRDSVTDLRGKIEVKAEGELGGAVFRIELPTLE